MAKIFGCVRLVDIYEANEVYRTIKNLLNQGIIDGIQILPQHPLQPRPDKARKIKENMIPDLVNRLPGQKIVHSMHEYGGAVVPTENFDPEGTYDGFGRSQGISWQQWNALGFQRTRQVVSAVEPIPGWPQMIVHPGCGINPLDPAANAAAAMTLSGNLSGLAVGVEINPINVIGEESEAVNPSGWPAEIMHSVGASPASMADLLVRLPAGFKAFFDFTHLQVLALQKGKSLEELLEDYCRLPYWPVCHFSGVPDSPHHDHPGFLKNKPYSAAIHAMLQRMEAVILETGWRDYDKAKLEIRAFQAQYPL